MLIPARTDTRYFHDFIYHQATEIRFIKGRLKFGGQNNPAPFPSMVVVFKDIINKMNSYAKNKNLRHFCRAAVAVLV